MKIIVETKVGICFENSDIFGEREREKNTEWYMKLGEFNWPTENEKRKKKRQTLNSFGKSKG